ncbi:MAG: NAD(P)-dependent oxidoreductase [Novosphingobium sp.]|nr:NAD(P)-dependent oxidoreductase [Novosphingobium sp.]
MEHIGFIGLGSQGGPMAERIVAAGLSLAVWARNPAATAPFAERGARVAASVAELGALCGMVGICVIDDAGVRAVCDELIPAMAPGSRIVIHATVLPETCARLAEQAGARGIAVLDAPVSGGGPAAAAGTLTVMCGGDADTFAACRPVFETFAGTIVHLGPLGSGQRAKIVNNALMAANMGLAHAAMGAGQALGMDRAALAELIKASSGRSFGFEVYARLSAPGAFAHGAPLLVKDVGLLSSVLAGNADAAVLAEAASHFLSAAAGGTRTE